MKYIKKFESTNYTNDKIKEIVDFIGNIFDILLPYSDDGCEYVMQLWIKGYKNDKSRDFHIHFDPEDIYEDLHLYIEGYLKESRSLFLYDKFGYSLNIKFTKLGDGLLPNILERIRSEYSPPGKDRYIIDYSDIYPQSLIINDPVIWREDFGK